jgi:phospholipid/cholesterol/gamma-HCH transport system substrate-binding protein
MPSQKELRWSQLKVGILTFVALTALVFIIFLLSNSTGGLFSRKLNLIAYFENANGLKVGAPVALDGVTIGNVTHVRIVLHHEPAAVEVISRVGAEYLTSLHTDSTVAIDQAGVLGDAFVNISSVNAKGPEPADNATLPTATIPGVEDVIRTSQESIQNINGVVTKLGVLMDTVNKGKGTVGMLLNDPAMAKKVVLTVDQLQTITQEISDGKGSVGKLLKDQELYDHLNSTIGKLDDIATKLNNGEGTAGKLLKDDTLYKNLNTALTNTNELLNGVNQGKGSLGKLVKDPQFANKLEESIDHLNVILQGLQDGKGTVGQLMQNRSVYDDLDKTLGSASDLITAVRKDPKTYLKIQLKIF